MKKRYSLFIAFAIFILLFNACKQEPTNSSKATNNQAFELVKTEQSNIAFNNQLLVSDSVNYFTYRYFFMGSGVGIGDFNKDGLEDVFFGGNVMDNQLYLNKSNLQFEEVSKESNTAATGKWTMGCSIIDINTDGLLDIYLSIAGKWASTKNILYINQGVNEEGIPTFEDQASQYGIADEGNSVQSTFLDYDGDGDLDLYVANYPATRFDYTSDDYKRIADQQDPKLSDHLYRNNGNGTFTDVTLEAGILNYGLSIGVIAADFNNDHLTDIYVSNDFHTPDKYYLNNGDGTFTDQLNACFQHTAFYGMGVDAADYNNDGLLDLLQVDMTPPDNYRSKANMAGMNPKDFYRLDDFGYQRQYMYNALQSSQGIRENGLPFYSEIAKAHNLGSTDWSWACFFADLDNDAFKDIFISNGTRREMNNKDYFKWLKRIDTQQKIKHQELSLKDLMEKMPSYKVDNFVFQNKAGQTFERVNNQWNLEFTGFSNGAAYVDLDNDGDLEILLNNIDSTACLFKNLGKEQNAQNHLQIKVNGPDKNPLGLGTKIEVTTKDTKQYYEHTLVRGYLSSISPTAHFGLGNNETIKELKIIWPDKKTQLLQNIEANQVLSIDYKDAKSNQTNADKNNSSFFTQTKKLNLNYTHQENDFDDFKREILLPHQMSSFGPGLAIADVNQDGIDDFFVGSPMNQSSVVYLSNKSTNTQPEFMPTNITHPEQEDVAATFFDADQDGDQDLYVVCGGNEKPVNDAYYQDRLYLNDGNGNFTETNALPNLTFSGSVVKPFDIDKDGDLDLFVGGRQMPGNYPSPATSFVLENKLELGSLTFEVANKKWMPDLEEIGMVTDAAWVDVDLDKDTDLVLVGEWMPITIMENRNGKFYKNEPIKKSEGWWNTLAQGDFDKDGDVDFVLGNLGLNYKYQASPEASFDVHSNDFDENGKQDIVLSYKQDGEAFPVRGKQCSSEQIPILSRRFETYESFATSNLEDIYGKSPLANGTNYQAWNFANSYLENKGNGKFELTPLPIETQTSSINAIVVKDLNKDGFDDLVLAGNLFDSEVETPRNDACYGWVLLNDGKGKFVPTSYEETGLYIPYETRNMKVLNWGDNVFLLVGNNDAPLQTFELR